MDAGNLIFINDARGITIQTVRAEGRRLKAEQENLALILEDLMLQPTTLF